MSSINFVDMPEWKSKVLNAVAWLLGFRGEYAYVITLNFDIHDKDSIKDLLNNEEEDTIDT